MNQGRSKKQYRNSAIGAFISMVGIGVVLLVLFISNLL